MPRWIVFCVLALALPLVHVSSLPAQDEVWRNHLVRPGETWTALSARFGVSPVNMIEYSGTINTQREPAIGSIISLREISNLNGQLIRPVAGGLLEPAVRSGRSPWGIALRNRQKHPYAPALYSPIFLPGGHKPPFDLPFGFASLAVSDSPAGPGEALGVQASADSNLETQVSLANEPWNTYWNGNRLLAIGATDPFYGGRTPELRIQVEGHPTWTQPWLFEEKDWYYDQVTFVANAANEQEAMQLERTRLKLIWGENTPEPLWTSTFTWPIKDYVELTSHFGARRSVNGGPYDSYHEGTDFSAYRGTPVYAPAGGKVVLAETLVVRGGAVILDHGLGIHTGYYHMSEIKVLQGDEVEAGDLLGQVGTTGRSTGNHLHWDLLVGTTWVDAEEWMGSNLGGWFRVAWGGPFPNLDLRDMPPRT